MNTQKPNLPNDPPAAAAYWFARVHSGNFTVAERERFQQWRRANPNNEQEYRALDEIWQATSMLPKDELRELLEAPNSPAEQGWMTRRRLMIGAASVSTAAIIGAVFLRGHDLYPASHVLRYVTAHGEQRKEVLPDGSVVEMNVSSELIVSYDASRRVVELIRGEASFEVVANSEQVFTVVADNVDVRVTGTVFNVRRNQDHVSVAVQSGSVEVSSGRWWNRETAVLTAGMTTHAWPDTPLSVDAVNVAALTAWRQGKVVFRDELLEDVVQEMNRYLREPIYLTDSRLKHLRMAGVFSIQDAEGFLQALQTHLPVVVVHRPDGGVNLALLR